ncbi:MAG: tyrosine-type recombinase/integrase [Enterococcus sp.]
MWIEETMDKKGKKTYKFSERYLDPRTRKRKKVSITYKNKSRDTQKNALYALNKKIEEKLNDNSPIKKDISLNDLYKEFLLVYEKQVSEGTFEVTQFMLRNVINGIGEKTLVSLIDYRMLTNIFDDLIYKKDLSNRYVNITKAKTNLLMKYALRRGYITDNPVTKVELNFKRDHAPKKIYDKYLENDEYQCVIDYTMNMNKRYGLLFQWLYFTGMRAGEALALQKADVVINEKEAYAKVTGTMIYLNKKVADMKKSTHTKTKAGQREVDLPKKAIEIYYELLELSPEGTLLFQTSVGTPIAISTINVFLRKTKDKIGINKKLSSHIFRHTHISKLASLGTPLYVIKDRVGHEDSKITESIYLHVTKDVRAKLKEDIEKL